MPLKPHFDPIRHHYALLPATNTAYKEVKSTLLGAAILYERERERKRLTFCQTTMAIPHEGLPAPSIEKKREGKCRFSLLLSFSLSHTYLRTLLSFPSHHLYTVPKHNATIQYNRICFNQLSCVFLKGRKRLTKSCHKGLPRHSTGRQTINAAKQDNNTILPKTQPSKLMRGSFRFSLL